MLTRLIKTLEGRVHWRSSLKEEVYSLIMDEESVETCVLRLEQTIVLVQSFSTVLFVKVTDRFTVDLTKETKFVDHVC